MREEIGAYKIFLYVAAVYYWGHRSFLEKLGAGRLASRRGKGSIFWGLDTGNAILFS